MVVDDLFFVVHAAVTDLYGVTVEDFSKFVVFWEVFVYQSKNSFLCLWFPLLVI